MRRLAYKNLIRSLEITAALVVMLSLPGLGTAFAAQPVFPFPPVFTPPPPPCISTGPIYEFPTGCYTCQVRNVSANTYGVTITLVNEENQSETMTPPVNLPPGRTVDEGFCTPTGFLRISCTVTTQTGTVAALGDLAVVELFAPGIAEGGLTSTAPSSSETEGKIFNSCVPSSGTANAN